ncbi:hypothetical protein [Prolixibacter denitrificans]|jgi:hypothetical protein|uniref:Uncharacterized protein n=1 Tax=Prolixibacter denitrificans TaxID=1541063 RepID=A0A2P8CE19_9BACT|nr:hypothetical protein [Prolixibacter denitrificans]PSK83139.1 hypothetical protein CLV93_10469 [Prolixibacter denitrificans]GET21978.1 hypothetical protein JCM18694_22240 [Prolixibacter denitrificans]
MKKQQLHLQEEQVNLVINRMLAIGGESLNVSSAGSLLREIILASETGATREEMLQLICGITHFDTNDDRTQSIYRAICEEPFEQTYHPFENTTLINLRKTLGDMPEGD